MSSHMSRFVCYAVVFVLRLLLIVMTTLLIILGTLDRLVDMLIKYIESEIAVLETVVALIETSDSNATVPTDSTTQRIVPPTQIIVPPTQNIVPPTQSIAKTQYHRIRTDRPMNVKVWSYTNIDRVETAESVKRSKEKINVIFNMMNERNLLTKCKEVRNIIVKTENKCLPWLARYIVTNRISIESNHHTLYFSFLNSLNNEKLTELINLETENNIIALLSRDKISPVCKIILTNLGSWYGMMTLGKNKPISKTFGNLTILLINAYYGGEEKLMYTLPLVAKILEACANSTVFNTASPWTLDVLYCLSELHHQPGLKFAFQFKIEILCKQLKIELKDLKHATRYFTQLSRSQVDSGFRN